MEPSVLTYAPMLTTRLIIVILLFASFTSAVDSAAMSARRKRAANAFHDGILMVHALSRLDLAVDGFRQDPYFYYLTGLENTVGAIFALDGKTAESWLFLRSEERRVGKEGRSRWAPYH